MATAVKNPDGSIVIAVFNPTDIEQTLEINYNNKKKTNSISAKALQTLVINP
jgi:glucosylceramidase